MGRTIGAINKKSSLNRLYTNMPVGERLSLLANLIANKILDDQHNGCKLLNRINGCDDEPSIATS